MKNKIKFFLIYKITNLLNNHIYIGAHTTNNINDNYLGSSKYLKKDIKELGKQNFKKDILFIFDNKEDMMNKEAELVNKQFCHRLDTYNKIVGGIYYMTWNDMIITKDKDNNLHSVYNNDPRYLSGELVGIAKNMISVKDINGNNSQVSLKDPRYLSGELLPLAKNKVIVKDKDNNIFQIDKNDSRYLSGELKFIWNDKQHTQETKDKIANKLTGLFNPMYGKKHTKKTKDKQREKLAYIFYVYKNTGEFVSEEKGIKEYARIKNINSSNIFKVLKGICKQSNGFKYFYEYKGLNCNI